MAIGDINYNNNNKNGEEYRATLYSVNSFTNTTSELQKSKLSYSYWKGMLKISIANMIESEDDSENWDYKKESAIYLSPVLAYQTYLQVKAYLNNKDKISKSVKTKKLGVIKIADASEYDSEGTVLVIEKFGEDRKVKGGGVFHFNNDKYYGLDNLNEEEFTFDKSYFEELEIDFLLVTLREFWKSSTGAQAYFMIDYGRFDTNRTMGRINAISNALGIENKGKYNKGYGGVKNDPFESNSSKGGNNEFGEYDYGDIEGQLE